VKFAVMLPQTNRIASADALVRVAEAAEELDFHAISVRDHIVFNGVWITSGMRDIDLPGDDRNIFEALMTLAFVASRTERIRLGTSVIILPNRHPLLLAKQLSTLDVLSGGRLLVGFGVGPNRKPGGSTDTTQLGQHRSNLQKEYDSFGGAIGHRGRRLDEYLEAVIAIWTEERPSFDGEYVHFEEVDVFPKPIQKPYPPILFGGRSAPARRRVARFGDGWIPSQVAVDEIREGLPEILRLRDEMENPKPLRYVGINMHAALAPTDDEAEALAHPTVGHLFADRESFLERTIVGSVDTFRDRVLAYRDAGVDYVELKPVYRSIHHCVEQLRMIRDEIMPAVTD
jgi:alkanesulfonate monooxygenase SsuD/methylene tetrahydromethanopterin reductase-like flavin-dependent oxidoreductase (luciferase family)